MAFVSPGGKGGQTWGWKVVRADSMVAMFLLPFPVTFGESLTLLASADPSLTFEVLMDW